jgi:hypothetical protein
MKPTRSQAALPLAIMVFAIGFIGVLALGSDVRRPPQLAASVILSLLGKRPVLTNNGPALTRGIRPLVGTIGSRTASRSEPRFSGRQIAPATTATAVFSLPPTGTRTDSTQRACGCSLGDVRAECIHLSRECHCDRCEG